MTKKHNNKDAYLYTHLTGDVDEPKKLQLLTNLCNNCAIDCLLDAADELMQIEERKVIALIKLEDKDIQ